MKKFAYVRFFSYLCRRIVNLNVFISMEDKSLELLTPEQRKLHEEFEKCRTEEDFQRWDQKAKLLNESQTNQRTRLDMTYEEFCQKYNVTPYEEMEKRIGGK